MPDRLASPVARPGLRTLAVLALTVVGVAGAAAWVGRHRAARVLERVEDIAGVGVAAGSTAQLASARASLGRPGALDVHAQAPGPHPRILLTPARLTRVAALRDAGAPSWTALLDECRAARDRNLEASYESWGWAHAALALAICAKVTKDEEFGAAGVRYFKALLDDKATVGDGAGGDTIVRHDDGYSIRTHGALGAIAYDWLHDAPGMTPELRKKGMDRLLAWTSWFKEKGFSHDEPISNYYVTYFGAVAFGGIAFEGDDPRADLLRRRTQDMWNEELVPTYRAKLRGGDFPEGWQYGDLVGTLLAIFADAEVASHPGPNGGARRSLFDDLPWLRETVALRAHALEPDGKHTYDNADWSHKPAVAPAHMLEALSMLLPSEDAAGRQATFLARLASRDRAAAEKGDYAWLRVLADDPSRPAEDPRQGEASYLSPGTATVFARGSSSPNAIWASLTCEPTLATGHEHRDDGHFEIVRGSDPLLIDPGGYGSFSSFAHNVVLVDDPLQSSDYETSSLHRDIITYKSVQGAWDYTSNIARFEDGGGYSYALGSYDAAFNPAGFPDERKDRAVSRAEREWLYSRTPVSGAGPGETGRFVIYDRFTFTDPRFVATFILHGGLAPRITGTLARFTTGASSAWVTTLLPKGAITSVVDETRNAPSNDRPCFTNVPEEGTTSFRYQVAYPAAPVPGVERRFLHAIVVGAASASPEPGMAMTRVVTIEGAQVVGAAIDGEAYVFSSVGPAEQAVAVTYRAPTEATRHLIFDLAPSAQYAVTATRDGDVNGNGNGCRVALTPGHGKTASPRGVLALDLKGCNVTH